MDEITQPMLLEFLKGLYRQRGSAAHHIESMNVFYEEGISDIIRRGFSVKTRFENKRRGDVGENADIVRNEIEIKFAKVEIHRPLSIEMPASALAAGSSAATTALYPNKARELMQTYSMHINVTAEVLAQGFREQGAPSVNKKTVTFRIGKIPCMVKSRFCNLHGMSRDQLIGLSEDPSDEGGYFIFHGAEHSVDCQESPSMNEMRITTERVQKEIARCQIWSKPGDGFENSYQSIVRQLADGAITISAQLVPAQNTHFPFYLMFRLIADIDDRTIASYIIGDMTQRDPITTAMISMLQAAFMAPVEDFFAPVRHEMRHDALVSFVSFKILELGENVVGQRSVEVRREGNNKVMDQIDAVVLPHLGTSENERTKKHRYLGLAIRKLMLARLGVIPPLDRDTLCHKRIHLAGTSVSKSFKSMFNRTIVIPIRREMRRAFENMPFSQVKLEDVINSAIGGDDLLESTMAKALTIGNTTIQIGRSTQANRVSSQSLYRKNDLNVRAIAGNIAVNNVLSNKTTERAERIRHVHPTMVGYIDGTQSADTGDKVGMNKQIAVSAIVSMSIPSANLKKVILDEEARTGTPIIPLDDAAGQMAEADRAGLSSLMINGDWVGYVRDDHKFVARWRQYRRNYQLEGGKRARSTDTAYDGPVIHKHTSICRDPCYPEVRIWCDYGRMLRPLLIVYNNLEEYNARCFAAHKNKTAPPSASEFKQWVRITPEIVRDFLNGSLNLVDLQNMGVIEYIAADESENMLLANSIVTLREHEHDLCTRYTHCDIEQAIFGIVALSSPLPNHAYGIRITYFCNQRKQACSWYSLSYPFRRDKKTMMQLYCERPLVSCFTDDFVTPTGHNCTVAIMSHTGYNQEDSIFVNAGSVARGMFMGMFFDYETSICMSGEMFNTSDRAFVVDRPSDAITDMLEQGVARVGSIVHRNCVLISKIGTVESTDSATGQKQTRYVDRSTIYMSRTPARITGVIRGVDEHLKLQFICVKYMQFKTIIRGDKCSSRTGNKGIVSRIMSDADMPYTEDGLRLDVVINPQSIPTRRALNQIIESLLGEYCAQEGCHVDATSMLPINMDAIVGALKRRGFRYAGYRRVYNGMTGEWIDLPICVGPTTYQRLEKFVDNECRAIKRGPVDAVTRQPIRGSVEKGALKIGEMEMWTMVGHGAIRSLAEKVSRDSDGTILHICRRCGNPAIYNARAGLYSCAICKSDAHIVAVQSSWASNLMREEVRTLGIKMQYEMEPHYYYEAIEPK